MRLRVNGEQLDEMNGYETAELLKLFAHGADQLMRRIEPYVLASYYYTQGSRLQVETLVSFILSNDTGIQNEARALNLRGVLYLEDCHFDAAIREYEKAIEIDPRLGVAYNNWGIALARKGDL